jgi:hypothetical protein
MGLDLSADDVTALEERTEVWIAGLQLAALSMRGKADISSFVSAFTGTERHVFDYLAEEVLDRQPEGTRSYLLRTSILDRLSGPLCDAVTGQDRSQSTLEKLERRNLLMVPLGDRWRGYRYHHLFSDFLRQRPHAESPELVSELHKRASGWHEANGTAHEAIGHALATRDFDRAAVLIERLEDSMLVRGESPIIERLIKTLPEEITCSRPRLDMAYAYCVLMAGGRWGAAESAMRDAEQMVGIGGDHFVEPSTVSPVEVIEDEERAELSGKAATFRANIAYEGRGICEAPSPSIAGRSSCWPATISGSREPFLPATSPSACSTSATCLRRTGPSTRPSRSPSQPRASRRFPGPCVPPGAAPDDQGTPLGINGGIRAGTAVDRRARRSRSPAGQRPGEREDRRTLVRMG